MHDIDIDNFIKPRSILTSFGKRIYLATQQ